MTSHTYSTIPINRISGERFTQDFEILNNGNYYFPDECMATIYLNIHDELHDFCQSGGRIVHFFLTPEGFIPQLQSFIRLILNLPADLENNDPHRALFEDLFTKFAYDLEASSERVNLIELFRIQHLLGAIVGLFWDGSNFESIPLEEKTPQVAIAITSLLESLALKQPHLLWIEGLSQIPDEERELFERIINYAANKENIQIFVGCDKEEREKLASSFKTLDLQPLARVNTTEESERALVEILEGQKACCSNSKWLYIFFLCR